MDGATKTQVVALAQAFGRGYVGGLDGVAEGLQWREIRRCKVSGALIQALADLDSYQQKVALDLHDDWTRAYFSGYCFALQESARKGRS